MSVEIMPSTILCPLCDFELALPDLNYQTGSSGIPVPTGDSVVKLNSTEATMEEHVASHSPTEIIEAFRKADVYIAQLERDLRAARHRVERMVAELDEQVRRTEAAQRAPAVDHRQRPSLARLDAVSAAAMPDERDLPPLPAYSSPQAALAGESVDDGYVQPDARPKLRPAPAGGPGGRPEGVVARR